jgi:hypothetical protein
VKDRAYPQAIDNRWHHWYFRSRQILGEVDFSFRAEQSATDISSIARIEQQVSRAGAIGQKTISFNLQPTLPIKARSTLRVKVVFSRWQKDLAPERDFIRFSGKLNSRKPNL